MEDKKYPMQVCQDDKITSDFRELHNEIVQRIIDFCKTHNIEIEEFYVHADGLLDSIKYGQWCPSTDSQFEMYNERFDKEAYLFSA